MSRPPLGPTEKALVAALAFQVVFMGWQIASGAIDWELERGPQVLWSVAFAALVVAGIWLTIRYSPVGHLCGALVYLAQLVQVGLADGGGWKFTFTPTMTFRITSELPPTVAVNLVALVLLIFSVAAFLRRRLANELAGNQIMPSELLKSG
jgi:hypothetical protein